jgi:DNA-binding IclR family transcriptional regulator
VSARGLATSVAERIPEAAGAAAAYFRDGEPAGAIDLTIPRHRLSGEDDLLRLGELVKASADRLTAALAAPAPPARDHHAPAGGVAEPSGVSAERRSIVRVAAALDALARCSAEGLSVEDLAEGISCGRATAARLLGALGELDLARQLRGDRYVVGAELLVWAARLGRGGGIGPIAADLLAKLVRDIGESAYLATYDPAGECVVFEAGRTSEKPIQYVIPLGSTAPLHAGAAGKAVLAHSGGKSFEAQRFDRFSPTTIVDRSALREDLERVRERGYAVSRHHQPVRRAQRRHRRGLRRVRTHPQRRGLPRVPQKSRHTPPRASAPRCPPRWVGPRESPADAAAPADPTQSTTGDRRRPR